MEHRGRRATRAGDANGIEIGSHAECTEDFDSFAAERFKNLVQDRRISPHILSELLQNLPPQALAGPLLDHFFSTMFVWYLLLLGISHFTEDGIQQQYSSQYFFRT